MADPGRQLHVYIFLIVRDCTYCTSCLPQHWTRTLSLTIREDIKGGHRAPFKCTVGDVL